MLNILFGIFAIAGFIWAVRGLQRSLAHELAKDEARKREKFLEDKKLGAVLDNL